MVKKTKINLKAEQFDNVNEVLLVDKYQENQCRIESGIFFRDDSVHRIYFDDETGYYCDEKESLESLITENGKDWWFSLSPHAQEIFENMIYHEHPVFRQRVCSPAQLISIFKFLYCDKLHTNQF